VEHRPAPPIALLPADIGGVELVAKFFRALGDVTRLRLLEFLLPEAHTVGECVEHVGLAQGRVSAHLACLADCGYVTARRDGRRTFYQVTDPRVADLVLAARALAADNANALAACMRIDTPTAGRAASGEGS
jgi:ArsR family transcriptional regulator, cadmium/lead-responsive transcriptional repressor